MKRISTLIRAAICLPVVALMLSRLAWEVAKLPEHDRDALLDALLHMGDA